MINFVFFFLKIENFDLYNEKKMVPAVPIGAAGEKFLKFDTFPCIFKSIFVLTSEKGGAKPPLGTMVATPF